MCVRTACAMRICSTKSRATRRDDPLKAARTHASTPRALIWYRWRRSARGGLGCPHLARFHQDQGQAACGVSQQSAPPARFSLPCLAFTLADRPPVLRLDPFHVHVQATNWKKARVSSDAQLSDSIDRSRWDARTRLLSGHQVDRHSIRQRQPAGSIEKTTIRRCTTAHWLVARWYDVSAG